MNNNINPYVQVAFRLIHKHFTWKYQSVSKINKNPIQNSFETSKKIKFLPICSIKLFFGILKIVKIQKSIKPIVISRNLEL